MPSLLDRPSYRADLAASLGTTGEAEYGELVSLLQDAQGMFALMLVRSDFTVPVRDALLERLAEDLGPAIPLRVIRLTQEHWEAPVCVAESVSELGESGVIALVSLEDTPGIVPTPGEPPKRPPAIATLNHGREALRRDCPYPLLVWCEPLSYAALREHAPDFFDHFTGIFTFLDAAPSPSIAVPDEHTGMLETKTIPAAQRQLAARRAQAAFYEELLQRLTDPTVKRARALLGLAESLRELPGLRLMENLTRAEAATREALTLLSPEETGEDWARGKVTLGNVLGGLATTGGRSEGLQESIDCYHAALSFFTRDNFPEQWAATQINLGSAYSYLSNDDHARNFRIAIEHYQAALTVYDEQNFPEQWAGTLYNLGSTYAELQTGDQAENLQNAINCYQATLKVYTESDFPQEWAKVMGSLGYAYAKLPNEHRVQNLREAIDCFRSALRVFTEEDFPREWATSQHNLGLISADLALATGSLDAESIGRVEQCFVSAARGFVRAGLDEKGKHASEAAARVKALLMKVAPSASETRTLPLE